MSQDLDLQIEYPSAGTTYCRDEYGVYGYGSYPASSVLSGRTKRVFLGSYASLAEAQLAFPEAVWADAGSSFVPDAMLDLPDEDGRTY